MQNEETSSEATEPWSCEFDLSLEFVGELIQKQFPLFSASELRLLGEGWDSRAILVDDAWVFRLPKRRERSAYVESEIRVLELLNERELSLKIPTPEFRGFPSEAYPCSFFGYRLLEGTRGDLCDPNRIDPSTANLLGKFLSTLHSLGLNHPSIISLPRFQEPMKDFINELRPLLPQFPPELRKLAEGCVEYACNDVLEDSFPLCLTHSDLADEHLLFDASNRLRGVIDWGDTCISDPAIDFAGLYAWLGRPFVEEVLKHDHTSFTCQLLDRITKYARV